MLESICKLVSKSSDTNIVSFETSEVRISRGKLIPKNNKDYIVLIVDDNPDIRNIKTEIRMTHQALFEYKKRLPYGIKIYDVNGYYKKFPDDWSFHDVDVTIEFIDQDKDDYFSDNVNAYGGFPNGSFKGIIRFNNSRIWWDGRTILGSEAKRLGIVKNANDSVHLLTYNYKRTVKHEFGHVLGLEHNSGVMSAFYNFHENMLSQISLTVLEKLYGLKSIGSRWLNWIKAVMTRRI